MNYRKESGSRETRTLSPGLLTMIVKIRLKHIKISSRSARIRHTGQLLRSLDSGGEGVGKGEQCLSCPDSNECELDEPS